MGKQKIITKNHKIQGNEAVITETVEKVLTKADLINERQSYVRKKEQLREQMINIKNQYQNMDDGIAQLDKIINDFKDEKLPDIPS